MDQKNLIAAIVISAVILIGSQFLFKPPAPPPVEQSATTATTNPAKPAAGTPPTAAGAGISAPGAGAPNAAPATATPLTRAEALAASPRVRIDTRRVHGSIALTGGRLDDLTLPDYRETIDRTSPEIVLLSPAGSPEPYYGEVGWTGTDPTTKLPGGKTLWQASGPTLTQSTPVTLTWDNGEGLKFSRTFAIDENFLFTVTQKVENTSGKAVTLLPYSLVSRHGTPPVQGNYILHEGPLGVFRDKAGDSGTLKELNYKDLVGEPAQQFSSTGGWIGITDKYWLTALIPADDAAVKTRFSHAVQGIDLYQIDVLGSPVEIAPNASASDATRIFAGAKEVKLLDRYQEEQKISRFDRAIDWGYFYFLTRPIFKAMDFFNFALGNFGLAILLLTIIIKTLFLPLAYKSYVSMNAMKELQPEVVKLRERCGDDRARLNQEMMALYKARKVNPAAGCLPILLQIPVFFSLYKVLYITIEMRHAPFYGWIQDLAAPDPTSWLNLFGLLPWGHLDLGPLNVINIGVWPILMGISMVLQMRMNPQPPDPVQAKIFTFMPIIFTFMMAAFPAGLIIYWTWNNMLGIAQQWVIKKRMATQKAKAA